MKTRHVHNERPRGTDDDREVKPRKAA